MTGDTALARSTVAFERDDLGAAFAVELVTADRWLDAYLVPPPRDRADARLLLLRHADTAPAPGTLPGWLRVAPAALAVAEDAPAYAGRSIAAALWAASPYYERPAATVEEFLTAAAAAIRAPGPVPADLARCVEVVHAHAAASGGTLAPLPGLDGLALDRWLHRRFRTPDALALELLIERIEAAGDAEQASLLRFLHDAEVDDAATPAYRELALDRRALIEQASPWRYFEAGGLGPAIAAVRLWARRYRAAYDAHYREVVARARLLSARLAAAGTTAEALRRLDAIPALGDPVGAAALASLERATHTLAALPALPDPTLARTAGVTLGAPLDAFATADRALDAVRDAVEVQRGRLARRAAHLVLDREDVSMLDRLLQAISASDVDGLERVLDARLAAHIEQLLAAGPRPPAQPPAARR